MSTSETDAGIDPPREGAAIDLAALWEALVERAQDLIVLIDDSGVIRYVNPAVERMTGWRPAQLIGTNLLDLSHPDDVARALFDLGVYSQAGAVAGSSLYRVALAGGGWRQFDTAAADMTLDGRRHLALYSRPAETAAPAVLDGLLRRTSVAEMLRPVCDVFNWHLHGSLVGISWHEGQGYDCVGTDLPRELSGGDTDPATPWAVARRSATAQRASDPGALDDARRALAAKLGVGPYWIEPVLDDRGEVCALVTLWMRVGGFAPEIHTLGMEMAKDYVELIVRWTRQQSMLDDAAHRDELTGVGNRKVFFDALEEGTSGGGVLYCDLDRFKAVNDELGHQAGDDLLVAVARRLQGCVRRKDVVARLGGDEFAVLCPGVSEEQLVELAQRARAAVIEPYKLGTSTRSVGISIGLAYSSAALDDDILDRADRGLYRAKSTHDSSICWAPD
jgi:diguanylate cyclase (GGDEF)-like protein/PAS domain S-box-containing protein